MLYDLTEEIYKFLGTMSCIKRYMYARIEGKVGRSYVKC